jgi:hypothetical protein
MIIPLYIVTINPTLTAEVGTNRWMALFYFSIKIFYVHYTSIAAAAATAAAVD